MKRYTLNENKGDIAYEVEDNLLTLKVRPEFVSSIPVGEGVYIIKTGDNTIPSDYNVLSAKRTMEEIEGAITGISRLNSTGLSLRMRRTEQSWKNRSGFLHPRPVTLYTVRRTLRQLEP